MKPEEKIERAYEELRAIIDGGSESFTHEDAVQYLKDVLAKQEQDEPLHESEDVSIGVDVTDEGTSVIAMRKYRNGANVVFYSQFHPLVKCKGEA